MKTNMKSMNRLMQNKYGFAMTAFLNRLPCLVFLGLILQLSFAHCLEAHSKETVTPSSSSSSKASFLDNLFGKPNDNSQTLTLDANKTEATKDPSTPHIRVPQDREQIQLSFSPVVKKVAPAVVNIYADRLIKTTVSPFLKDPIFRHFFGDGQFNSKGRVQKSLGSGVIIDPKGIVITNYHVISGAEDIRVVLLDGREMKAQVVVKDKRADLVALKLQTDDHKLPFLKLRDADKLEVGDLVLAFGNPFGFGHTVTSGIVSGLARSQVGTDDFRSLIQTDAAVNPGNSGGALVTMDGRLVGINTAIFSNTGGSIGISFAVPSNLVMPVLASVELGQNRVVRPWIGVKVQTITSEMAEGLGLPKPKGVLIQDIFEKGSAEKAGLQRGDVILKINGYDIVNESGFKFRIATLTINKKAKMTIWRDEKEKEITVNMVAPPQLRDNRQVEVVGRNPLAGAFITGLTPTLAEDYNLSFEEGGVVIYRIKAGTLARLNGLLPGDVITTINKQEIKTVQDVIKAVKHSKDGWAITYRRGRQTMTIRIQTW